MSSSVRFIHCGGFRLDDPFWEGPAAWAEMRNQDLWQTFEALLSLCREEKIDILLLTGDVFEQEHVRKETVERVAQSFAKLEKTRVFIAPGEKDPLVTTSAYRLAEWPENVHLFSAGISRVDLPQWKISVYGSGWITYRQEKSFLADFPTLRADGYTHLMLLHAVTESARQPEGFIPITQQQIAASGLSYLALGHQENWSGIRQTGDTFWADCGSPEPRSFHESESHGVILGEIEEKSIRFEFRELGQRHYIEKSLTIETGDIKAIVSELLADTTDADRQKNLFRIHLKGTFSEAETDILTLQNLLADQFSYAEVIFSNSELTLGQKAQSQAAVSEDSMVETGQEGFSTLLRVFTDKIQQRRAEAERDEDRRHWELVQKIGLTALGQGREDDED